MRMYDIIIKKRNGEALTDEEIAFFIKGYTDGSIPKERLQPLQWRWPAAVICLTYPQSRDLRQISTAQAA